MRKFVPFRSSHALLQISLQRKHLLLPCWLLLLVIVVTDKVVFCLWSGQVRTALAIMSMLLGCVYIEC
jgi:hypothetical protein